MPRRKPDLTSSSSDEDGENESRNAKRQRVEVDVEERLESLIDRVGSKGAQSLESNLEGLATVLDADLANYRDKILQLLFESVTGKPDRISVYSTLVGLLNVKNSSVGAEFIELLVRRLKECLREGRFESARLIVRFLADLVNCHVVSVESLLTLFDNFVEVTLEDNIPQVRSDFYVHCVLSSLLFVGQRLHRDSLHLLSNLLATVESYMHKRENGHVVALRVWSSDRPHRQEDMLYVLWQVVRTLQQQDWTEDCLLRPYKAFLSVFEECATHPHTFPQVIPPNHDANISSYPLPRVVFRMFDYTDVGEANGVLPGAHAPERFVTEEIITFLIDVYKTDRKVAATQLCNLPVKLRLPTNYMIVEVIIGQMLQLPESPHLQIYMGSLLIELCREQPSTMPQVLAQAVEMLFDRLDTMKVACRDRFVNWFAYHLSNFKYQWSWEDWADCLQEDSWSPKRNFINETVLKLLRFSYLAHLQQILPKSFKDVVPVAPEPEYKFAIKPGESAQKPLIITSHKLVNAIKSKCTNEEAHTILKESLTLSSNNTTSNSNTNLSTASVPTGYEKAQVDVFFSALFFLGSKSFSHSFAALSKYHTIGRVLTATRDGQLQALASLHEVWLHHHQMVAVIIDKMLKLQLLNAENVVRWIFTPAMHERLPMLYVWEIVHETVNKVSRHTLRMSREAELQRDRLEAYQSRSNLTQDFGIGGEDDPPSQKKVDIANDKMEEARFELRNLLRILLCNCIEVLSQLDLPSQSAYYNQLYGRVEEILFKHHRVFLKHVDLLENEVFTSNVDSTISQAFKDFLTLQS